MSERTIKFKDFVEFQPHVRLESGEEYDFIPMEKVKPGTKYVQDSDFKVYTGGGAKFSNGDTIFARITPCLENNKIAKIKNLEKNIGFGSTEYFVFRAKDGISDPDYIYYLAKSDIIRQPAIKSMVGASGRQRADKGVVENIDILDLPLITQQRIGSILSTYDDLIENNQKHIKLLEEAAQNIYREWFVHFRFPGHETTTWYVDDKGRRLPDGWKYGTISNLVSFQNGFAFKSEKFTDIGQPIIKIKNISDNTIDIENADYVDADYASSAFRFKLEEGDLLIAMTGATIGKVGYLPYSPIDCYLNQRVGRFIHDGEIDNKHFVFCAVSSENGLQQILNLAGGAAQPNISGNQILSIESIVPKVEFQELFYRLIDANIKLVLSLRNQNRLLKEARDILLPRLMNQTIAV